MEDQLELVKAINVQVFHVLQTYLRYGPVFTTTIMLVFEAFQFFEDGVINYLKSSSNYVDIIGIMCNYYYFGIQIFKSWCGSIKDGKCNTSKPFRNETVESLMIYAQCLVLIYTLAKANFFLRVSKDFGLLVMLIRDCVMAIIPFFIYTMIWITAIELMYDILGGNANIYAEIESNSWWQFFFLIW